MKQARPAIDSGALSFRIRRSGHFQAVAGTRSAELVRGSGAARARGAGHSVIDNAVQPDSNNQLADRRAAAYTFHDT